MAYNKIFTSEAMKAATATGVMAATINIIGAHYGVYRVRKSKIAKKYYVLKNEYKAYELDKQTKEKEITGLQNLVRDLQVHNQFLKERLYVQEQKLTSLRWKATARKEAIEKLPFFLRPTVQQLPAQSTILPNPDSSFDLVEAETPTKQ